MLNPELGGIKIYTFYCVECSICKDGSTFVGFQYWVQRLDPFHTFAKGEMLGDPHLVDSMYPPESGLCINIIWIFNGQETIIIIMELIIKVVILEQVLHHVFLVLINIIILSRQT